MIDYKKYKQVLEILKGQIKRDLTGGSSISDFCDITDEQKASAICELFDEKTTWAYKNINTPMTLGESQEKLTPPYIATCCKG